MGNTILRSAALCIRANLFLQEGIFENVAAQFDEGLNFSNIHFFGLPPRDNPGEPLLLCTSPKEWFEQLKSAGITSLRLNLEMRNHPTIHEYQMAWSVDAAKAWTIASKNPSEDNFGFWGDQTYMEQGERFGLLGFAPSSLLMDRQDLQQCASALEASLIDAVTFCEDAKIPHYGDIFKEAISILKGQSQTTSLLGLGDKNVFPLIPPQGILPELGMNIIRVFELHNIFGGQGSWNDLDLQNQDGLQARHHTVSLALFKALTEGLINTVNSQLPTDEIA